MRRRAAMAGALLLAAPAAMAEDAVTLPGYAIPETELERFTLCRAAVFYHLDGPEDRAAQVPRPVARTLGDQIDFIAAEVMVGRPIADVAEGQTLTRFFERWFLRFAEGLATHRDRLGDVAERDRTLLACIPEIWIVARDVVDQLVAWRRQAMDPPRFRDDADYDAYIADMRRRLGLR